MSYSSFVTLSESSIHNLSFFSKNFIPLISYNCKQGWHYSFFHNLFLRILLCLSLQCCHLYRLQLELSKVSCSIVAQRRLRDNIMVKVLVWDPLNGYVPMEKHNLKNVNNYLNTNIYSYLDTSDGQSSNLYLNLVHFFNTRHL
jgi:hypothetical protein